MIKAKHNIPVQFLYRKYLDRQLRSNYNKFNLLNNTNEIPDIENCKKLIVTPNHFSWWDGFFIDYVFRKFSDRKPYVMMFEEQLKKYRFLKYIGAFSIKKGSVSSVSESLKYAKSVLDSPSNYLIFYPQGEIQNYEKKYVTLKRGLTSVADKDTKILIVTFKIVYGNEKKPDVFCRFCDKLITLSSKDDFNNYENLFLENI
ncbi:MAG TPA: lysophospholipid acyltransferase family protein, partial [Ignavibacteria bacterium]|nr:lysophospholipid acyltransferase family protein [Ignavibacteria bacterium]